MPNMLTEEQMVRLGQLMEEADAANPTPPEEEPEMEETLETDEVDTLNENTGDISDGDGEATDEVPAPDPDAGGNPQAPADYALPDGFADVNQLIAAYNELKTRGEQQGDEMGALREMTGQLVAIAEALGYGQDMQGIDLNVDESLAESNPKAYADQRIRREIADQLKPMLEAQQRNLRGRMIDMSWKAFAKDHEDVSDMMDDIRAALDENKSLYDSENGMEAAYHLARSRRYKPEKLMLEDEAFIDRAAKNEKIRAKVIEDYLKEIGKSGEGAPASVGGGGKAVPAKKKQISMEEAHQGLRRMLGY